MINCKIRKANDNDSNIICTILTKTWISAYKDILNDNYLMNFKLTENKRCELLKVYKY